MFIKKLLSKIKFFFACIRGQGFFSTINRTIKYALRFAKKRLLKKNKKREQRRLSKREIRRQKNHVFPKNIKYSIIVPLYNTPHNFLEEMIESVLKQTYSNFELCLADASDDGYEFITEYVNSLKDDRIKYKKLEKNYGISGNTNIAIEMSTGDYIALFDHDDYLHQSALYYYTKAICEQNADFIYCDEDKFTNIKSPKFGAYYKPDFAPDMLRCNNYICHFTVFKKSLLDKTGLFNPELDGSQDHDMILRLTEVAENIVHIPRILYHWRISPQSVASDPNAKPYTGLAGRKAVQNHLDRLGLKGSVTSTEFHPNFYRIHYDIVGEPLVSIIIPTMDYTDVLSRCLDSIFEKTTYKNFEIILVENNSKKKETFEFYDTLESNDKIRVITCDTDGVFNYPKINNAAAKVAKGEYFLFLNNDTEVIAPNWIEEMLMFAQRSDVGAVGAKLYFPDYTIQHGGVILGVGGVAGHGHLNFPGDDVGYFGRLILQCNYTAVTAACVMIRKDVYNEVGGLDESFKVAFNDVDLCMKIRKAGYLICWTPYAELYHYESKSRGYEDNPKKIARFKSEMFLFQERWQKEIRKGDPYYNENLTLDAEIFTDK